MFSVHCKQHRASIGLATWSVIPLGGWWLSKDVTRLTHWELPSYKPLISLHLEAFFFSHLLDNNFLLGGSGELAQVCGSANAFASVCSRARVCVCVVSADAHLYPGSTTWHFGDVTHDVFGSHGFTSAGFATEIKAEMLLTRHECTCFTSVLSAMLGALVDFPLFFAL